MGVHNHKMEESTRDELYCNQTENKKSIIAEVQNFTQDDCACHRGFKGGQFSDHFTEETVLNIYTTAWNCLTWNWT